MCVLIATSALTEKLNLNKTDKTSDLNHGKNCEFRAILLSNEKHVFASLANSRVCI